jgi:hypothetical protein
MIPTGLETKNFYAGESQQQINRSIEVSRRFRGTCRCQAGSKQISACCWLLASRWFLVSCLAYSSVLKMKATVSFDTSVDSQPATRRVIPKGRTLIDHVADAGQGTVYETVIDGSEIERIASPVDSMELYIATGN